MVPQRGLQSGVWSEEPKSSGEEAMDLNLMYWAWREHREEHLELSEVEHTCRSMISGWCHYRVIMEWDNKELEMDVNGAVSK